MITVYGRVLIADSAVCVAGVLYAEYGNCTLFAVRRRLFWGV